MLIFPALISLLLLSNAEAFHFHSPPCNARPICYKSNAFDITVKNHATTSHFRLQSASKPSAHHQEPTKHSENISFFNKLKNLLSGKGLSGKGFSADSLKKLGLSALLSYGFVSNFSYVTAVIISWCIFGKATQLSPLAPGQWKPFLAVYAGLWAANNVLRPLRFSLSVVISPVFDKIIDFIQLKTDTKRSVATGITVFLINFIGTITYLVGGLFVCTRVVGVPLLP
mmetsp:Transcript_35600/g.36306  ORF Transcript_35600/g.36306 Transcript_35600/m.36306 type:complete len:227 (+) Transcript_35600:150-830(+)